MYVTVYYKQLYIHVCLRIIPIAAHLPLTGAHIMLNVPKVLFKVIKGQILSIRW